MKKIIIAVLILAVLLIPAEQVSAHVLVTDGSKTQGAILHIIPDDDPVAGERATLYFDMQNKLGGRAKRVTLSIVNTQGVKDEVDVTRSGTLATASYTFATQGVYDLTYTVNTDETDYVFQQSQRVTRGVAANTMNTPQYAWAEMLLIGGAVSLGILAIVAFNRRKMIARQSTF